MNKENDIIESAKALEVVNYQVAELLRIKEELEKRINALLEHGDDQQKTYTVGIYKIVCKSGYNYVLDKNEYEFISGCISSEFNPVKKVMKYEIDKKTLKNAYAFAGESDLRAINDIIKKNPSKLFVSVKAGV